jgi:enamine deaminase RidA (YjgF/YER057c/UK114 family)
MTIKRMSLGGEFEAKVGYCRAVVAGGFVYVSGCVGVDRATGDVPDDVT